MNSQAGILIPIHVELHSWSEKAEAPIKHPAPNNEKNGAVIYISNTRTIYKQLHTKSTSSKQYRYIWAWHNIHFAFKS